MLYFIIITVRRARARVGTVRREVLPSVLGVPGVCITTAVSLPRVHILASLSSRVTKK